MRKLLQSKAVVSLLVAVAVAAVAGNFVSLPKLLGLTATARGPVEPPGETVEPAVRIPPTSRISEEQKLWRDLFPQDTGVRDPFAPLPVPVATPKAPPVNSLEPVALVLQAISCEPNRSYAVINQQIVTLGDRIDGYSVEHIRPGSVELTGPTGPLSLTLKRSSRLQNPTSVKPSGTDLPLAVPQTPATGSSR